MTVEWQVANVEKLNYNVFHRVLYETENLIVVEN